MLKVRKVITHSPYSYSPTRLLHESISQQGLIIQIEPSLCCIAEEGIEILKSCFQESKKEDIGDVKSSGTHKQAGTRAPEGSPWKGSHAEAADPRGAQPAKLLGQAAQSWLGACPKATWRASFHTLHKLASRKTEVFEN